MNLLVEDKNLLEQNRSPGSSKNGLKLALKAQCDGKRPSSPGEDKCPICLVVPIENKAIANKCFHSFCKVCLMEWAKVRMECPLCRQPFSSILYNIKSEYNFKEYKLEDLLRDTLRSPSSAARLDSPFLSSIFGLSLRNPSPYFDSSSASLVSQMANRFHQPGTLEHRRHIYSRELYCLFAGNGDRSRRRESNPQFYRQNPASIHRLRVFLDLELRALIHDTNNRSILMQVILNSLTSSGIATSKFQRLISQYLVQRTLHFIHEFYNFAISVHETAQRYYERAIYVERSRAEPVQISYDYEDQVFDLSDPYNYRISRVIYNDINNNVSPFGGSASNASSTPRSGSSTILFTPQARYSRRPVEPTVEESSSSSDSDDDVIFEGITKAAPNAARRADNDTRQSASVQDAAQTSAASTAEDTDPKPGPSGLSNNRINLTLNQLRSQYTDDSDSDYDSDNYLSRTRPGTGLRLFESDDEEERKAGELKRALADSSDDDNSIEYVGFVKPRHLRTPELIEILTSDDEESEYKVQPGGDLFKLKLTKRLKTEHREKSSEADRTAAASVKCKCKIRCKAECKRASV